MSSDALPVFVPDIVRSVPHDTSAFTQGLCFHNGELYESTGQYASSSIRHVDWNTGKVLKSVPVPSEYFAEGLAVLGEKAYQLTWRENMGFVYDLKTLKRTGSFSYYGEGWGLTTDGQMLIMSDGSNILRFLDANDFSVKRTLFVTAPMPGSLGAGAPLNRLNELEYIGGEIYANVWYSDSIARINPTTGKVTSWIDMSSLGDAADRRSSENVLNGIAHDPKRDVLLVTGKLWAKIYEIKLKPKEQ
jgi:glutamine cyclotransferase